jgi:hypothetical protein
MRKRYQSLYALMPSHGKRLARELAIISICVEQNMALRRALRASAGTQIDIGRARFRYGPPS